MIKRVLCSFCHKNCGVLVHIENGKITKVEGDSNSPLSGGRVCLRGMRGVEFHYHPDRLNYPLKRVGKRGEGRWKKIPWDEALNEIAEQLMEIKQKCGPEALSAISGTYRSPDRWAMVRFLHLYGSPNYCQPANICFCNTIVVNAVTYGAFPLAHVAPNSKCIVIWGKNPAQSYQHIWADVLGIKKKGVKLIVIDPRYTEASAKADIWLRLRPQTDCALGLGWINVIIREGLYDEEFIKKWTVGFDELKECIKEYEQ